MAKFLSVPFALAVFIGTFLFLPTCKGFSDSLADSSALTNMPYAQAFFNLGPVLAVIGAGISSLFVLWLGFKREG